MADRNKILIISHGHPDYNKGGGEIAAHTLHNALNTGDSLESVFMARHDKPELLHGGTPFSGNGRPGEILFHAPMADWFRFTQPDKAKVWRDFRQLLDTCQPDIVHFHHYLHLGLELLREVRNFKPNVPIVMTLHEFFAICHNHGQMIRPHNAELCRRATPSDCSRCFPEYTPQDFMMREQFVKSHLSVVNSFIAPSEFLARRYREWGIPASRIQVIENLPTAKPCAPPVRQQRAANDPVHLAYFGQIKHHKGLHVLLEAMSRLPESVRERVRLDINGSGLDSQPEGVSGQIQRLVQSFEGKVRVRGTYQNHEVPNLMQNVDWMVMPSIWWENSPMVVLEARQHGVPVICSNLGGMAEKVDNGVTGLHFMTGRAESLAARITEVVEHPERQAQFAQAMRDTHDDHAALDAHNSLYDTLLGRGLGAVRHLSAA